MDSIVILSISAVIGAVCIVCVLAWKGYNLMNSSQENDQK